MQKSDQKYQSRFINFMKDIFLCSLIHPYLNIFLNLFQYLTVLGILLIDRGFIMQETNFQDSTLVITISWSFLVIHCIFIGIITLLCWKQKTKKKHNVFVLEYQGYMTQTLKKIVALFLIIYRKILGLIVFKLCIWHLQNNISTNSVSFILFVINLALFVPFYLFSGVIYANKIAFMQNAVSFAYKINLQTLLYLYLPIIIVIEMSKLSIGEYLNIMFVILSIGTLYIRPLILYRQNIIGLLGCGLLLGLFLTSASYKILQLKIDTHQDYIWFLTSSFFIAWIIMKFAQKRISYLLLFEHDNSLIGKLNTWNKDEILFYHLVNYDSQKSQIFLYLVQELQTLKNKRTLETINQGSEKTILEQQEDSTNKQSIELISKIIQTLKSTSFNDPVLKKLFNQFIFLKYRTIYNPKNLLEMNLGKKQLLQRISRSYNIAMIVSQVLMLEETKFRRCYTFMRLHEKLLRKVDSLSLLSRIEIFSLLRIIENDLRFKSKSDKEYDLKAERYFIFQNKYEQIKKEILKCCQNKLKFWQEYLQAQPNSQKVLQSLKANFTSYHKIINLCQQVTDQYKHKSPIIFFDLIVAYTTKILNVKLYSSLNPFCFMIKKYEQSLTYLKREGALLSDSKLKKFSLLQNIGVCKVDLQNKQGKIIWANEYFWSQFYDKNFKETQNLSQKEKESYVFDIMVPELSFRHRKYFKYFTQSHKLNHQHDFSFVYRSEDKVMERVSAEIQVIPSFENGFNISVFLFKTQNKPSKTQKFSILLKDDMSIVSFTESFLNQKDQLAQSEYKKVQIQQDDREFLCQQLTTNQTFHEFLEQSHLEKNKIDEQISVYVGDMQLRVKVLKIYSLEQKFSQKIFPKSLSTIQPQRQQIQKKGSMYLLEFSKIKNNAIKQDEEECKGLSTNEIVSKEQQLSPNSGFLKTQESQFTSLNTCYIDKALNRISQGEKIENHQQNKLSQKQQQEEILSQKYRKLLFPKGQKITKCWGLFAFFIFLSLTGCIVSTIAIFKNRQQLYEEKKMTIKYFNELITDICQLTIALREYNYYAYINGPEDPRIPLLMDQVKVQESQVEFKMNYLSGYLDEKWWALEVLKNGFYNLFIEQDYVVIANYMLSSMTYLSSVEPKQMQFPIFLPQYLGRQLTPAQVNFNEAIYNGIFVVLTNLSNKRQSFLPMILKDITDISGQVYIYPCFIGLLILLVFMIVSIRIEKKSQNIKEDVLGMLGQVSEKSKRQKISSLIDFKQNNCYVMPNHFSLPQEEQVETKSKGNLKGSFPLWSFLNNAYKNGESKESDRGNNCETENDTKRDLVDNEQICDLQRPQTQISKTQQPNFQSSIQEEETLYKKSRLSLPENCIERNSFFFYIFIVAPSIVYFMVTLFSGFSIDSYMAQSFQMGSEIHNKKTNVELVFLYTRETFYYQKLDVLTMEWKQMVMNQVEDTLKHDRMLQRLINENQEAIELQKLMKKIDHGNLCNKLPYFSESVYYDVDFSVKQCEQFEQGLLMKGLKQTEVSYLETAVFIINLVQDIEKLSIADRYKFLTIHELKMMKTVLVYLQQLMDMMDATLEIDLDKEILSYSERTMVYAFISILGLGLIIGAVRFRWGLVKRRRRAVVSIVQMITLEDIKKNKSLAECFSKTPLEFFN